MDYGCGGIDERALEQPGLNERLQYARRLLPSGFAMRSRLQAMIDRTMNEGRDARAFGR